MSWFGPRAVEPVWVTTKTGQSIKGILVDRSRDVMVLRAARLGGVDTRTGAETWTPLLGDIVIPWDNLDYYQAGLDVSVLE